MRRLAPLARSTLVALLFLAALELCFRGLGLFDPTELSDPYLGFPGTAPLYRVEAGPQGASERHTSPNKRRAYRDVRFPVAKHPSELRVFCIGGSSLQLESFSSPAAAFPDFLELYLGAAAPGRAPRVINAGGGATGSVQNLEVLREVLDYGPDLLVVYPEGGQKNLVPPAPASYLALRDEQSPARVLVRTALAPLRVYAAARESLQGVQPADKGSWLRSAFAAIAGYAYARPFDEQTFGGLFEFKRDSVPVLMPYVIPAAEIERAHRRFRRNLEAMADLAAERGVPLVFVLPQRNAESSFYLRFHIDPSEIRPGQIDAWRSAYAAGLAAKRAGRHEEAVRLLEQVRATYVEDRDDLLAFHLAECHAALGREPDALREYALCIRRHPLQTLLREVAAAKRVPLIDPFEALVAEAGGRVPGHELFVDSMHPFPAACRTIARSILEGLLAAGVLDGLRTPEPATMEIVERRCAELARASTEANTPVHARIYRAIRQGDLAEAVRLGETRPRAELMLNTVDLFYYGWALTLAGRLDEARALYEESRAMYVGADTRLPDLSTPEAMIEIAFGGDVFAFF